MSKTLKNRINYFGRHLIETKPGYVVAKRSCHKYVKEDIPEDVKHLLDITNNHRYGNKRNMMAKKKVHDRRAKRFKDKEELRNSLNEIDYLCEKTI